MTSTRPGMGTRREDDRLVAGRGRYTDDIRHPGALHAAFVRSPYPSARIVGMDLESARSAPGVVAVLTGHDMVQDGFLDCPQPFQLPQGDGSFAVETPRPLLVRERVRFVGEPVVMVIAETATAAQDGAELVSVDYEDLPAVTTVEAALAPDAPQVWDDRPGNVAFHWRGGDPAKVDAALAASHHVTRLRTHVSRVGAMPMEPRTALAYLGEDGRPVLSLSHQSPHQIRDEVAARASLPRTDLRVLIGDVGGSFGMKWGPQREEILVFWASRHLQRAVRWTAQRSEAFLADEHARDAWIECELGLDAQGRFTALKVHYDSDMGGYMSVRSVSHIMNIGGISGVYTTPAVAADIRGVFTNTQTTAAYRGAGRPDATYAIERLIDVAASELGMDAVELRRRNLIPASAMPYKTSFQFNYDSGDFERVLDRGLELADYAGFAQRREQALQRGRLRGIGVSMSIEVAAARGGDWATIRANPDGSVSILTGSMSVGQGHETGFPKLLAEHLGLPVDKVRYEQGDTDLIAEGKGNGGSSALVMGGTAIRRGADDLIERARLIAARELEAAAEDIEYAQGSFRVVGTDRAIGLGDLASASGREDGGPLAGAGQFAPEAPTYPNGCHVCELEVDPETGRVEILNYVSVEDIGTVLNPVLVEGQIHGGVVQGIGQSLMEEIRYDESGQIVTGSFMDYAMPRASDLPSLVSESLGVPTRLNPLGVKGVGEAGTVGALSATTNAICNALQAAGVRHLDMPATPVRVWQALRDAGWAAAQ